MEQILVNLIAGALRRVGAGNRRRVRTPSRQAGLNAEWYGQEVPLIEMGLGDE